MALRINTNIAAMSAHKSLINTDNKLSSSLERLSTGLRINKAADDASGMAIADSLRSQSLGLGQAIRNGNDGISIVQTADAALQESINIVNTIKQKAIQAAQDGQTTESRKAIQADISKLREELDTIAKTTAFNNQKLLSGNFTNKKFQIGAYAGETVDISIQSTEATKIGHITTSDLTFEREGVAELEVYSNLLNQSFSLNSIELSYNNSRENSLGAVADALNKLSDTLGISATAVVETSTESNVAAGVTDSTFAINGVTIGSLTVQENDSDGALVAAINQKSDQHGVLASVDQSGILTLTSVDDRAIQVTAGAATTAVLGGTEDMSTLGKVEVRQEGTSQIVINDVNDEAGISVSVGDGLMKLGSGVSGDAFILTTGSLLQCGSLVNKGTEIVGEFTITSGDGTVSGAVIGSGGVNIIGKGSVLSSGHTIINKDVVFGGTVKVCGGTMASGDSYLTAGSVLGCGTAINSGGTSTFIGDVSMYLSGSASGSIVVSGGNTYVTCGATVTNPSDLTLTASATLFSGSALTSGIVASGSHLGGDTRLLGEMTLTSDMDLGDESGALIGSGSILATGTLFESAMLIGKGEVFGGTMSLTAGSTLFSGSSVANGSTLGSIVVLQDDEYVAENQDMLLAGSTASGAILNSGTIISAGTLLTNDIIDENNITYAEGTLLEYDIITGGQNNIEKDQILNAGSMLSEGTQLDKSFVSSDGAALSSTSAGESYRLSDVDVTSQEGAQIGIAVADAALKALDKVRSDLGSVQNQLTSTIANISTTRVNVSSAESTIRDVDFAEESSTFTKMQILSQAGTFAMSQANASAQNVLSLLQ